ncbi:MAG TPA: hypothetical protein VNU23_07380 [Candidatus Cybelea sp.]|jgi:hypothetical protein|nr:hypothetical protein [Candidatus Cybelea sp.]
MRIHAIRKMPLSIDEEENRCTGGIAERSGLTEEKEKGLAPDSDSLRKLYKIGLRQEWKTITKAKQNK